MLVLQNLDLAADQIAVSVKAIGCMAVEHDLWFCTDQYWLRIFLGVAFFRFRGQVTGQHPVPFIAIIGMHMGRFRRLRTDQLPLLQRVAGIGVSMYFLRSPFHHGIAAVGMLMGFDLW